MKALFILLLSVWAQPCFSQENTYSDLFFSFNYPSSYTVSSEKKEEGMERLQCVSEIGNGFMLQKILNKDPEVIAPIVVESLLKNPPDGYTPTQIGTAKKLADGKILKGTIVEYKAGGSLFLYEVYPAKIKEGGIVILILMADNKKDLSIINKFWETLKLIQ